MATARAWACLCAHGCAAGPAGCALGAPSLFLDSVLFLSHFLGTVHEHCSSQKFSKKKLNQLKSNQMRQNFQKKNENFKNKFLWKKNDLICGIIVSYCIKCGDIEYELYILSMNSVSGLCLCLRDIALYLTVI